MVIGYRLGWVSGTAIRAAIARAGFRGMTVTDYEAKAKAFARDVLPGVLRPEMMTRIAAHRASGDTVVVVSGAYDVYLKHWCAEHGLDLIASTLEVRDGRLTGRYAGAQNVLAEKARHVRERFNFSAYAEIHAHGDTPEDQHLLALATRKFYRARRTQPVRTAFPERSREALRRRAGVLVLAAVCSTGRSTRGGHRDDLRTERTLA